MKRLAFFILVAAACGVNSDRGSADAAVDAAVHGTFAAQGMYPTGVSVAGGGISPIAIALGDLNGDGKPDVAVANTSAFTDAVLLNTGTGTLAAPVEYSVGSSNASVAVGDYNGDGKLDLVTTFGLRLNDGSGNFTMLGGSHGAGGRGLAPADLDGDGKLDVVGANGTSSVSVHLGHGDGTFSASVTYPTGLDPLPWRV